MEKLNTNMSETQNGAVQRQPTNLNELRDTAFRMVVESKNNLNFFVVGANLPGLQLGNVIQNTPLGKVPWSGEHNYEELQIQFIVDEDLNNWFEVYEWMRAASTISDFDNYDIDEIHRNGSLILKNNQLSPNLAIMFRALTPTNLTGIDFDSRKDQADIVIATVTFAYMDYKVERNI